MLIKKRRDLVLEVGSLVYLKLRPYQQPFLSKTFSQKLAAKYYGPFRVLDRLGQVAYVLQLPRESCIHLVFHVSQLKPVLGRQHEVSPLPVILEESEEFILKPKCIQNTRYDAENHLEALIQWKGLPDQDNTWLQMKDIAIC